MKKILHLTLFLAIISALAGGLLSAVNSLTYPIIQANQLAGVMSTLEQFFPNAEFNEVEIQGEVTTIQNIYEADGEGVVYKVGVDGFDGTDSIVFMIAIDNDNNFAGYSVQECTDTEGIGSRVKTEEFYGPFIGSSIDTQIDTLSGATVSSTAVIGGIQEVVAYHQANY